MRTPLCNVISLALPPQVGTYGYYWMRTTKGAANFGAALAPIFILAMFLTIAAAVG